MIEKLILVLVFLILPHFLKCQCNEECQNRTVFGYEAGNAGTGSHVSFFGFQAGAKNTIGYDNSFFGFQAGQKNTDGFGNSFFGVDAGKDNDDGSNNSFYGRSAGSKNLVGGSNSFFGRDAGRSNTYGSLNSFFGQAAGRQNTVGQGNSFFGAISGLFHRIGDFNSFFGEAAGFASFEGNFNSFYGAFAGYSIVGDSCVAIGANSGPTQMSQISNRLFIDVKRSDEPLIYGEFDNDLVRVNGTFEAMGVSNNSDVRLKERIRPVDPISILDKILELPISEWSYKNDDIRHIGPMAQDFHSTFNLGKGETTITTIDVDGVSLVGIQALNQKLNEENKILSDTVEELLERIELLESRVFGKRE